MELVQEIQVGKDHVNGFMVTLGENDLYAAGTNSPPLSGDYSNQPVTDAFVHFYLRRTDFFDAFERAVETPDIATTFEPLPTP